MTDWARGDSPDDHKEEEEKISIVLFMLVAIMVMLIRMFIINVKEKDGITATTFIWEWKS